MRLLEHRPQWAGKNCLQLVTLHEAWLSAICLPGFGLNLARQRGLEPPTLYEHRVRSAAPFHSVLAH